MSLHALLLLHPILSPVHCVGGCSAPARYVATSSECSGEHGDSDASYESTDSVPEDALDHPPYHAVRRYVPILVSRDSREKDSVWVRRYCCMHCGTPYLLAGGTSLLLAVMQCTNTTQTDHQQWWLSVCYAVMTAPRGHPGRSSWEVILRGVLGAWYPGRL